MENLEETLKYIAIGIAKPSFNTLKCHTSWYKDTTLCIGVAAGAAGQVLAGPLLSKVKMKLHFCKKQAMNRSASMIFRLVTLIILLYNRQKKDIMRSKFIGRPRTKFITMQQI